MIQKEAMELLKLGHNVFLTGAAGSGKTYVLNAYITYLREHGVSVAITASTGIAATHLGGQTIHSWSGIGIREGCSDEDIDAIAKKDRIRRAISSTHVLVIDEVSMLHAHQLDLVDRIARRVRDGDRPFGGMQVILCGDFFQLPPVSSNSGESAFAYECAAWNDGGFQVCYLHEQFRQGNDRLLDVLNMIRSGTVGEATKIPLRERYKKEPEAGKPTRLYTRNVNVDAINNAELDKLEGQEKTFRMETRGFKAFVEGLKRSCLASETLRLKVGAEVMFIKNALSGEYVNGTRGVVEAFDAEGFPVVRTLDGTTITAYPEEWRLEDDGAVRASLSQVPLRLAWAITVHKSQGMTLDAAEVDLSDAFEPGMGYVALSRVRSLAGLKLMGLNEVALAVHPKILAHDEKFRAWSDEAAKILAAYSDEEKQKHHDDVLFNRFAGVREGVSNDDVSSIKRKVRRTAKSAKEPTHEITRALLEKKVSLDEIAAERGITTTTVISHIEKLAGLDRLPNIDHLKPPQEDFDAIIAEFKKSDDGKLTPIFKNLNGEYPFEMLRLVRVFVG